MQEVGLIASETEALRQMFGCVTLGSDEAPSSIPTARASPTSPGVYTISATGGTLPAPAICGTKMAAEPGAESTTWRRSVVPAARQGRPAPMMATSLRDELGRFRKAAGLRLR